MLPLAPSNLEMEYICNQNKGYWSGSPFVFVNSNRFELQSQKVRFLLVSAAVVHASTLTFCTCSAHIPLIYFLSYYWCHKGFMTWFLVNRGTIDWAFGEAANATCVQVLLSPFPWLQRSGCHLSAGSFWLAFLSALYCFHCLLVSSHSQSHKPDVSEVCVHVCAHERLSCHQVTESNGTQTKLK